MDDQCGIDCTGTNFVSNGSRGSTADILTDGTSVTNSEPNGGITQATVSFPSPEAVEEFKVQQTNFSAEYGFSGRVGGQYDHALGKQPVSWERLRFCPRRQP